MGQTAHLPSISQIKQLKIYIVIDFSYKYFLIWSKTKSK